MRRKNAAPLAALAGLTLALTGCGSGVSNAKQGASDAKLTIACVNQEDWCQYMTKAYQEQSGVQTEYVRFSGGEALGRLQAGVNSPEFDVWYGGGAEDHIAGATAGVAENYVSPAASATPAEYKDAKGSWTGIYGGALGFCSNTAKLAKLGVKAPTSWADLLDPKLKQEVAVSNPATSSTAFNFLYTQYVLHGDDADGTFDYLSKLNTNILQYSKTGAAPGQMAGRAEIAVGILFSHDCVKYKKQGMPLVLTFPKEGTGHEVGAVSLVKGTKNPTAAKAFIDWSVGAKAQGLYPAAGSSAIPTNPQVKADAAVIPFADVKLVTFDLVKAGKLKKGLVARFDEDIATASRK